MARHSGHKRRPGLGIPGIGISRARASKRHYPASLGGGHFWTGVVHSYHQKPYLRAGTVLDRPGGARPKRRRKFLGIF